MSSPSDDDSPIPVSTNAQVSTEVLTADGVLGWASRAVSVLSARRAEINALNVFPVPDADTGSNMTHTMEAALNEARKLDHDADVARITEALAVGSVRGARGNSGVVLSQVLRAIAQAAADGVINGHTIQKSLNIAQSLVDRAINDPVEGTVVTVLRATAIATKQAVEDGYETLTEVVNQAVWSARTALARTPSQLEVLREAGVVDAGGQGLVILLESLQEQINNAPGPAGGLDAGTTTGTNPSTAQTDVTHTTPILIEHDSHGKIGDLEVMFFLSCTTPDDLDQLQHTLAELGDSLLIARESDTRGTVHIHSRRAGEVIEAAFHAGEVTDLRLEILPEANTTEVPTRVLIAVTPPGSLAELYQSAGATVVTRDASELQTDEPSNEIVSQIVATARASRADEVILLPNGLLSKRELVSIERSSHAFEQAVTILPTSTLVSGIAAVSIHDPSQPLGVDSYAMAEAASAMRTAVLRVAASAALTQAGACSRGDLLAFSGQEILLIAEDLNDALSRTCLRLLDGGGEQVTLLIAQGRQKDFDEEIFRRGLGTHQRVDITVYPASGMENLVEIGVE
ncbi:DAK2 domain-containing protein [uncultured Corynebacterium sp.]|uniref:DAK2 domain-containing protein n=1 Tax=uncultured Corynebacterium sp. TaxID=159447 RepID=UPI0025FA3CBE|nr:DAK2 domain-containing protein [uncultured Corynebacterium sp.]